jgi:hypothetical protein
VRALPGDALRACDPKGYDRLSRIPALLFVRARKPQASRAGIHVLGEREGIEGGMGLNESRAATADRRLAHRQLRVAVYPCCRQAWEC